MNETAHKVAEVDGNGSSGATPMSFVERVIEILDESSSDSESDYDLDSVISSAAIETWYENELEIRAKEGQDVLKMWLGSAQSPSSLGTQRNKVRGKVANDLAKTMVNNSNATPADQKAIAKTIKDSHKF